MASSTPDSLANSPRILFPTNRESHAASSWRTLHRSLNHCQFFVPVPVWVSSRLQVFWKTPSQSAAMGRRLRRLMLCSQWHRREAERALETKSRNSARAGGRRSRRHTHSFKHTLKERGDSHTHKHSVFRAETC